MTISRLLNHNPKNTDLHDSYNFLELNQPLGREAVQQRLAAAPWLLYLYTERWPGGTDDSYVNAWAATVRIIFAAAVLDSCNPEDLGFALNLPTAFVLACLVGLESMNWRRSLLPAITKAAINPANADFISDTVDEFIESHFGVHINFLDLLNGIGMAL